MSRHPVPGLSAALCALGLAVSLLAPPVLAQEDAPELTPAPENAYLYIGWPNDGERVRSPFKVWFGLRGMASPPRVWRMRIQGIITCSSTPIFRRRESPCRRTATISTSGLARRKRALTCPRGATRSNWSWATTTTSCTIRRWCHARSP